VGNAEVTSGTVGLASFDSDGFTLGANTTWNDTSHSCVAWNWKAGGAPTATNSAGAGNVPTAGSVKINGANSGAALAGTIPATKISANTTSGFSIIGYTGTAVAGTVAHGLSKAPDMVIAKERSGATTGQWIVGVIQDPMNFTDYLSLDKYSNYADVPYWNDTAPTASVFSIGSSHDINESGGTYVAYCFHSVEGYSKVGSYKGNSNADGPFIYTGFKPAYIMQKNMDANNTQWNIWDVKRDTYNVAEKRLLANDNSAELDGYTDVDILSNGFKWRRSAGDFNTSGDNRGLFIAFASHPFKYSNAQ
jgi:hypothetical protein